MWNCTIFMLVLIAAVSANHTIDLRRAMIWLGGRNVSPGEQCRSRGYAGVCKSSDPSERCLRMKCAATRLDIPLPYDVGPALQGTTCGDNKICIAAECIIDTDPPHNPLVITDHQYDCEDPFTAT